MVKLWDSTFSELWELSKGLQQSKESWLEEKWLNLGKKNEFCGVLNLPCFYSALPSSAIALKNQEPIITVKTRILVATRGGRKGLKLLQSPILRELLPYDISGDSLEDLTSKAIFIWLDLKLAQCKPSNHQGCLLKTIIGNCITVWLPEALANGWGKQQANQKF